MWQTVQKRSAFSLPQDRHSQAEHLRLRHLRKSVQEAVQIAETQKDPHGNQALQLRSLLLHVRIQVPRVGPRQTNAQHEVFAQ